MDTAEILGHLQGVDIFADVPPEAMGLLAQNTTHRLYAVGECVIYQDDIPPASFLLLRGQLTLKLFNRGDKEFDVIGGISPSNSLLNRAGIIAIPGRRDIAQVEAGEESEVLEITQRAFGQFLSAAPDALQIISRTIARSDPRLAFGVDADEIETFLVNELTHFYGLGARGSSSERRQAAGVDRVSGLLQGLRRWAGRH